MIKQQPLLHQCIVCEKKTENPYYTDTYLRISVCSFVCMQQYIAWKEREGLQFQKTGGG